MAITADHFHREIMCELPHLSWNPGGVATPNKVGNKMDTVPLRVLYIYIIYSYGHLLVITGYKWDYTFNKCWSIAIFPTSSPWLRRAFQNGFPLGHPRRKELSTRQQKGCNGLATKIRPKWALKPAGTLGRTRGIRILNIWTYGYESKPWYPGEHQGSWLMVLIGIDPSPYLN